MCTPIQNMLSCVTCGRPLGDGDYNEYCFQPFTVATQMKKYAHIVTSLGVYRNVCLICQHLLISYRLTYNCR